MNESLNEGLIITFWVYAIHNANADVISEKGGRPEYDSDIPAQDEQEISRELGAVLGMAVSRAKPVTRNGITLPAVTDALNHASAPVMTLMERWVKASVAQKCSRVQGALGTIKSHLNPGNLTATYGAIHHLVLHTGLSHHIPYACEPCGKCLGLWRAKCIEKSREEE